MLDALQFSSPEPAGLAKLSDEEWKKALAFTDRAQLTLPLGLKSREPLPDWVRSRIDHNLGNNAERWRRTKIAFQEIAAAFEAEGLEFAVLKGFSHCPNFIDDPRHRWQSDFDLLLSEDSVLLARDIAASLGYEPASGFERHPIDHLPVMIRRRGWQWRGDYFDIEMPLSVELHFRLWDEQTERLRPEGLDQFWTRRHSRELDGLRFTGLHPVDALANSALHLLRHLLRGDLRPSHVYELASFLHRNSEHACLWNEWLEWHPESLRRLEAISFAIAQRWFDCRMPEAASSQIESLPSEVTRWLEMYSMSPLVSIFHPNKDELWLHWSLLNSAGDRTNVLRRRLLPQKLPPFVDSATAWQYLPYLASRALYHLRALPSAGWSVLEWFGPRATLGTQFWRFYTAFFLFNFGLFIFFLLYNLYLLQLGFHEDFLGLIASSMTGGSIAGSLGTALAIRRFGIRNTLTVCFVLVAIIAALRACLTPAPALIGLAFATGIVTASWAVCLSPTVAQLTTEKDRPVAFSFIFSTGILIGVLGGLVGGRLPGLLTRFQLASSGVASYRGALLAGCALVLLAVWPLSRVTLAASTPSARGLYRPNAPVIRFLIAIAAWNLGIGIFNPFLNVFFSRIGMPVEQIGSLFSAANVAQAGAVLMAPLVLRKFGLTRGVSGMQFATALALLALSASAGPLTAGLAFAAYTMSQYMTEPGMFTFLMDAAPPEDRSNASALNFLVTFAAQAVVAVIAGKLLARFGYPSVLIVAAIICALAALLFRVLLAKPKPPAATTP
ncbi:MAG TPA: MFS transporter [Bryobacteraceae bacterium]|nr:MFS transporter [Bryobacteraceae bacterium]